MLGTSVRALRRLCSSSSVSSINLIKDYTNKVTATARGTSICTCTIGAAKVEDIAASSSSCSSEPLNSEAHNENGPCACPSVAAVHVHLLRNNNKIRRRRLGDRRNNKRSTTDKDAIELALDSVVKIFTVSSSPNYFLPWQNKSQRESMGSGFVIPGKKILTNAHVVADHTFVLVRKHGSPAKYRAQVRAVGHECDLAILSVESEEFWNGVNSLELGDIPFLQEAVAVVGYPQGGDNISVTKGVVSRVEPTQYVHGATQLMAIQIDAAINPGNSGGPAIMGNKVAGVAFQNLSGAENIGYIIPVPVIKHFIAGVEESGKYVGFCSLGLSCQPIENVQLRNHFRMHPEMTGVLVSKISPLSDAYKVLKKDDIILAFDGVPVANDGTVPFRNRERITFDHLVSMKKPNETAVVRVLRDGEEYEINITLQPLQPLVPVHQFDKLPSYYIFAGLVFVPLTQPYLHEYGEDWYNTSPRRLCESALREPPKRAGEQLVILSQVLMDDINAGYERLAELQHHFSASANPNWPKSSSIRRRNPNTATRPSSLVIETVEGKAVSDSERTPPYVARRLILLRHANSSWEDPSLKDHDRPLSETGQADAVKVSHKLQQLGWIPQLILSSNAVRTRETLTIMQQQVRGFLEAEVHYISSFYSIAAMDGQTAEHLQHVICNYSRDDILTVMCMGHNRGWEEAASMFTGASIELKTCNAALLETTGKSWDEAFALAGLGGWKLQGIVKPSTSL